MKANNVLFSPSISLGLSADVEYLLQQTFIEKPNGVVLLAEPSRTALVLAIAGALAGISAFFSRASGRIGIPVNLAFLLLGIMAGGTELGRAASPSYSLAFSLGVAALVLILFDGGLNTPTAVMRKGLAPASLLATLGIAGTALCFGLGARLLGFPWPQALLLGAIVSSTDAAAVFAVLRGSGLKLKQRVGITLELESGLNDPMAVILTIALTAALQSSTPPSFAVIPQIISQLILGATLGLALGYGGRFLITQAHLPAAGLFPVLSLGLALTSFGLTTLLGGSGFLAVYLTAVVLGNVRLPYKSGLLRVHDAMAWLSQVGMFLILGLLVKPLRLYNVAEIGFILALFLAMLARPLVVAICLLPFRFSVREIIYISWVGLRGAVPIVLAIFPILARVPGAERIFDVVFFVVVISALIPGGTVRYVTRKLHLESEGPPPAPAALEISSTQLLHGEIMSFYIERASAVSGSAIVDLPFPETTSVLLIMRDKDLIAPKGKTVFHPGDHVYLFCTQEDRDLVHLIFGRRDEGN